MIVCGYAFSIMDDGNIRIVGLNAPHHASVLRSTDGEILETNMDDVELAIFVPADFNPDGINNISPDEMI